jgi:hypothetical protein
MRPQKSRFSVTAGVAQKRFYASNITINFAAFHWISWQLDMSEILSAAYQTRGPGATSLTWVILANISHINTCKVSFLYSGPQLLWTMTLTTWFWLDQLTSKFELFCLSGLLRFSKTSPLKQMKKCFTLSWPLITAEDHGLNKIDSSLSALLWYCGSWEENIKWPYPIFAF